MALTQRWAAGEALSAEKLNTSSIPVVSSTADITTPYAGQIIFNTTDSMLYRYTGSAWTTYDGSLKASKTALQLKTNNTLANDTELFLPLVANAKYQFEAFLIYDGISAADFKIAFTGPASAIGVYAAFGPQSGVSLTSMNSTAANLGGALNLANNAVNAAMCARPSGSITTAASTGNLQLQWAQVATNATATRVFDGSWLKAQRIA
jgi:hypothetical protein